MTRTALGGSGRVRFGVLALISAGTMINYLDRTVMGLAGPGLSHDLHLSPAAMGLVFSAFSWTYVAAQLPAGLILDRLGAKATYALAVAFWSAFTLLQGFATTIVGLVGFRFGLGVSEAPCFPTNSLVVSQWFPAGERARATGFYTVGEYVGLALFSPALVWIIGTYTWRAAFWVVGAAGLVFSLVWIWSYTEPWRHPRLTDGERDHILEGGGLAGRPQKGFDLSGVGLLLRSRQLWGAAVGQFAGNATLVFFLTWFPTYLASERHMGWLKFGVYGSLPFIAGGAGVLFGGWLSDMLLKRGHSLSIARKLPIITGLSLACVIVAANYISSNWIVVGVLCVAFFGQGLVGLGWTLISDIAPKSLVGLAGGVFNFVAGLAGIVTPILIGVIVEVTHSFAGGLVFIALVALAGVLSYVFLLGEVRRIEIPDAAKP